MPPLLPKMDPTKPKHSKARCDEIVKNDRRSGKELQKQPKFHNNGDAGFFRMKTRTERVVVESLETTSVYRADGRSFVREKRQITVREKRQMVAVGVIKAVDKKDPSRAKVPKSAAKKK